MSQAPENSQTAAEFIEEQLSLEAEAREALPYQFDTCTLDLGPLRQSLYACLTCNPPAATSTKAYKGAAVCYSCSISCHGEHTLVELFNKRNFVCDCGTTRMPDTSPCTLRLNAATGLKGDITGEKPAGTNKYNQNFRNVFCGCGEEFDAHQEKGTMFQCLGLGTCEDGGCGEDWWHPECLVGLTREEYKKMTEKPQGREADSASNATKADGHMPEVETDGHVMKPESSILTSVAGSNANNGASNGDDLQMDVQSEHDDTQLPPGFPAEDDFDHLICYKCVESHSWIKKYAGSPGFLPPVYSDKVINIVPTTNVTPLVLQHSNGDSRKRKAPDEDADTIVALAVPASGKRQKSEDPSNTISDISEEIATKACQPEEQVGLAVPLHITLAALPEHALTHRFSLFLKPDFRDHLCHCPSCFPTLKKHPQLLEEEDTYEPPVSEDGDEGAPSIGTGSLLDRGEAALNNMDRVRAIQGAMAYVHLKDKVAAFLKPFAESGQAVGAEDVKAYFEKLRGDAQGIQEAAGGAQSRGPDEEDGDDGGAGEGNSRREQSGY